MTPGHSYSLDLFFAERHTSSSNFRLTTSIDLGPGPNYIYPVTAIDPDDDLLSYRLLESPEDMVISSTSGLVSWTPTADQVGNHPVMVEVTDGNGGENVLCETVFADSDGAA